MTKLKVSIKNSQILVKCKIDRTQSINQNELDIFKTKFIRGLMRPNVTGKRKIEYTAPGNISLFDYLRIGLSKNDFFVIFAQFVECLKKVEREGFSVNNLILDTKYIFFNQMTREVQFIYQPINDANAANNVYSFIYEIINETVLNISESRDFINHLIQYLHSTKTFSSNDLEKYIIGVYPRVYRQVKRSKPGDSQILQQTGRTYFEKKYDSDYSSQNQKVDNFDEATGLLDEHDDFGDTGLLEEDDDFGDTGLLEEDDDFGDTGLLEEDDDFGDTGLLEEESDNYGTDVLDYDDEGTTVLDENEGTTVLKDNTPVFPYLIRLNTFEKVFVNKPIFRIGKEKSYVDFFVMSNNAVSRIHADIVTRNNRYYIKDNNSTNHTFVNGTMIPVNQETEIYDGDTLMLANEPFEFHVS